MADEFPYKLKPNQTPGASITERCGGNWRLEIPAGSSASYRLAQLDDYSGLKRGSFRWRDGSKLGLRARVSHLKIPGTWGFGLWNDPFAMGTLTGLKGLRLPALPLAAWFFYAGSQSYLSLRDELPAQGWLASTFSSPGWPPFKLALALPLLPLCLVPRISRKIRATANSIIRQDTHKLTLDPTEWNRYEVCWAPERSIFKVNGKVVLETRVSPAGPLGIVIWVDNQYAAWLPDGKLRYGLRANPDPAWLEISNLSISGLPCQIKR